MGAMKRDMQNTVQKMETNSITTLVPIPSPSTKKSRSFPVRESLSWFSGKMEEELQISERSMFPWETEFVLAILDDLDEQVTELRSRVLLAAMSTHPKIQNAVIGQCVQVANLAHMIASCHHPILSRCRNGKAVC